VTRSSASGLKRALFLDRDGVINVNHGYVHTADNFHFVDGIFDLVMAAKGAGFEVVVVTNQAGIARGYYSEEQFHRVTAWMCEQFELRGGAIDKVYFSPYHPTAGIGAYRRDEDTRKPRPGMILNARQELGLSLEQSILVGDQPSDIQAGHAAGVGLKVLYAASAHPELAAVPHLRVAALKEVIPLLHRAATESLQP
jgi:D-glycero-D-manno-heptose 1,7-bisphosphate phosphatase